jgi:hypothetical protein
MEINFNTDMPTSKIAEGARNVMLLATVVIVEVAAVAVVNGVVHAALSNAVDFTVQREVF